MTVDEWAEQYRSSHGHYPLIVGYEYEWFGQFVRIVEARDGAYEIDIESRFADRASVEPSELIWKRVVR